MKQAPASGSAHDAPAGRFSRARRWSWCACYLLPAALLLAVTLPHLGQGDWRGDSGWYSALGLSGWRSGSLWTLHAGEGLPYFNKPPLALWIHGLVLHVLGPQLWAARLPTVLAAVGIVVAVVGTARQFVGRGQAMMAGVVLALSLEFFRRCREVSLDLWQMFFLAVAIWLVAVGVRRGKGAWVIACGVPVGLALMCKPLMGMLAIPMLAMWLVCIGRARLAVSLLGALVVAGLVAAPWHVSMWMIHGREFTAQYFGAEIAKRAAGEAVGGQTGQAWWFYLRQIGVGYWPWLAGVVAAIAALGAGRVRGTTRPVIALGLVWGAAWLVLLSTFPDRRDRYGVAIYPGLALAAGPWLWEWMRSRLPGVPRAIRNAGLPAACIGGVVFAVLPVRVQKGADAQWGEFFEWMRSQNSPALYDGAFAGAPAARVMLATGRWTIPTADRWARTISTPPPGSLIAYHRRGGRSPGPGESVVFHAGDLTVTRLQGEWHPVDAPDPGE